ncbi:MAG: hypothetical protein KL801_06400 [Mesorhizobium sp.]|nr:hypothetical protein [Mesorhizobium sp.]
MTDGQPAALKQASLLAQKEVPGGNDYLRWLDGDGAVRLLNEHGDLSLMEWAGERTLLAHLEDQGDDAATADRGRRGRAASCDAMTCRPRPR